MLHSKWKKLIVSLGLMLISGLILFCFQFENLPSPLGMTCLITIFVSTGLVTQSLIFIASDRHWKRLFTSVNEAYPELVYSHHAEHFARSIGRIGEWKRIFNSDYVRSHLLKGQVGQIHIAIIGTKRIISSYDDEYRRGLDTMATKFVTGVNFSQSRDRIEIWVYDSNYSEWVSVFNKGFLVSQGIMGIIYHYSGVFGRNANMSGQAYQSGIPPVRN